MNYIYGRSFSGIERRAAKRKSVKCTVSFSLVGSSVVLDETVTDNLSSVGVGFLSITKLAIGTEINLSIIIPSITYPIKIKGRVARIEERRECSKLFYGVQFLDIDHDDKIIIEHFIQKIDVELILHHAVQQNATDIHLVTNKPVYFRINEELNPISETIVLERDLKGMIKSILSQEEQRRFEEMKEMEFFYLLTEGEGFRVSIHYEKGSIEVSFKRIPSEVPELRILGLPPLVERFAGKKQGVIIVSGPRFSGKSTTIASLIRTINSKRKCMILSLEDPIQYIHRSDKSIIKQRELGKDFLSYSHVIKHIIDEDADVVFIGELKDLESIEAAFTIAKKGHLVLTTMVAEDSVSCIKQLIQSFPTEKQQFICNEIIQHLDIVITQNLVPSVTQKKYELAVESLVMTRLVKDYILANEYEKIYEAIKKGADYDMQTMDASLLELFHHGKITFDIAKSYSKKSNDFSA